jgi:hypothetical protein
MNTFSYEDVTNQTNNLKALQSLIDLKLTEFKAVENVRMV